MKKLLTLLIVLLACLSLANAAVVDGTCGDNLTWSLNTSDSTLNISGSGAMSFNNVDAPWSDYSGYIAYINLPDGLTSICNKAFLSCKITTIDIPSSVTSIGSYAFYSCGSLKSIDIPDGVTYIGAYAFYLCQYLTSIEIPDGVEEINKYTFAYCYRLRSVILGSGITKINMSAFAQDSNISSLTLLVTTPPSCGTNSGIESSRCTLYVPASAVETYANTIFWEDFFAIKTIEGNMFSVSFVDWDNRLIARRYVEKGKAATAPNDPQRDGYKFIGWDKDFSNVTEDIVVTALYEEIPMSDYTLLFTSGIDDSEIDSYSVEFHLPTPPQIEGFKFLKWIVVGGDFDDKIVMQAIYEVDDPSIATEVYTNPANPTQKLIRNGNVYILIGDKIYSLQGQEVR